jgi:hypothetical protein
MQSNTSPHASALEDRQLVQITIDSETNGKEFQFSDEILAKEIILKGYSIYLHGQHSAEYQEFRGNFDVEIEWLKITGVQLTRSYVPDPKFDIRLPYDYQNTSGFSDSHFGLDFKISLPSQTSMRRRFKATAKWFDGVNSGPMPKHTEIFRIVLYIEVVHDHVFR